MEKKKIAIIAVALIAIIIAVLYFTLISPIFVTKPFVNKPLIPQIGQNLTTDHLNWVVNELGIYALHSSLSGEKPEIEMVVTDTQQTFDIIVENNKPTAALGKAVSPDLRISAGTVAFVRIMNSTDVNNEILSLYNQGLVSIELLKDTATLITKGYKVIYDKFQPTGAFLFG